MSTATTRDDESVERPPQGMSPKGAWTGVAMLALGALFINFDLTVLYLAIPEITADLNPSGTQQLWIIDIYSFMVAGFLIPMGALGDRIGRRRLLMIGSAFFGIASLAAAFSTSAWMLIAARILLGLGAATYAPCSLALLRNMFTDPGERAKAIGAWMAAFMGGSILGPVFGGVMLHFFWWGSVFLPAVVVMILVLAIGRRFIPEFKDPHGQRLDPFSVLLTVAGVLLFVWGVKQVASEGWDFSYTAAIAGGAILFAFFLFRQTRLDSPLIDLSLFKNKIFSGAFTLSFMGGAILGGGMLIVNLYMQTVKGYSPLEAGLLLTPTSFAMIVGIGVAQGLSKKIKPAYIMAGGLLVSVVGFSLISQVEATGSALFLLIAWALAFGGLGPATALGYEMILASAPPEKAGAASGTVEASGQLGTGLGIALLGSLSSWVYRSNLDLPSGLPAQAVSGIKDSMAQATQILGHLPGEVAAKALLNTREAFTSSLNVVALVAAAVFLAMALLALLVLRSYVRQDPVEGQDADMAPRI